MKGQPSLTHSFQEMGHRISPNQRFWIASAGIVLSTLFLGTVLIQNPWQEQRLRMASLFSDQQQRLEQLQTLERQGRTLREQQEGLLLLEGGAPVLTSHIARIAKQTGVEIDSLTPQRESSFPPYAKFQIQVTAMATLRDLARLLHAVENHRPFLAVDEIETDRTQGLSEIRRIRLLVSGYARKGPAL